MQAAPCDVEQVFPENTSIGSAVISYMDCYTQRDVIVISIYRYSTGFYVHGADIPVRCV